MIKVKVFKKIEKTQFDITTNFLKLVTNDVTDALGKDIEKSLNKIKCKNHQSNPKGTVIVNLGKPKNSYEFKDFCCLEYENTIRTEMTKK